MKNELETSHAASPAPAAEPTAAIPAPEAPPEKKRPRIRSGIRAGLSEPKLPRGQGASTVRRDFTGPELPRRSRRRRQRRPDEVDQPRSQDAPPPLECRGA